MSETTYGRQFHIDHVDDSRQSADQVVPLVMDLLKPKSVLDLGCGIGTWLASFSDAGVTDIFGIDGSNPDPDLLLIPSDCFESINLAEPFELLRKFDLVASLEVAEHIPTDKSELFVQHLISFAPVVLFSAAIPHQGGLGHINEQWPSFWVALFEKQGFVAVDCLRSALWNNPKIAPYYAQNVMIFVNASELDTYPKLQEKLDAGPQHPLDLVHPRVFDEKMNHPFLTLNSKIPDPVKNALATAGSRVPFLRRN